jgi:hypothetical protein
MSRLHTIVLLATLSAAVSGCFASVVPYDLVKQETVVDPVTGDVTRIFHWRYDDGYETTTTDTIPKGGDVERRRNEPRPQTRFLAEP